MQSCNSLLDTAVHRATPRDNRAMEVDNVARGKGNPMFYPLVMYRQCWHCGRPLKTVIGRHHPSGPGARARYANFCNRRCQERHGI